MKSSIKTCLAESKRITGSAKLAICIAMIISLAFTANLSAVPTIFLNADTLATGGDLGSGPLVTPYGSITFIGKLNSVNITPVDDEFLAAGASGNAFDIQGPDTGDQWAKLSFGFDVESIKFIYGGNYGGISIEARDISDGIVDSYSQSSTFIGMDATEKTLSGSGIRSLYWMETMAERDFAALDNITITLIPAPSAVVLAGIGVSFVCWLRKRKIV